MEVITLAQSFRPDWPSATPSRFRPYFPVTDLCPQEEARAGPLTAYIHIV